MHPTICLSSPVRSMVFINGAFAGEIAPDLPLIRPAPARGETYFSLMPLTPGCLPMARRAAFSAGTLLPASVRDQPGLFAVIWPGGITEIGLTPEAYPAPLPEYSTLARGDSTVRAVGGRYVSVENTGGSYAYALPTGAKTPVYAVSDGRVILSGDTDAGGRYALILSERGDKALFTLSASRITFLEAGRVLAEDDLGNTAGHVIETVYARGEAGYEAVSARVRPREGIPRLPATAKDAAILALNALSFSDTEAAGRYLAPDAVIEPALNAVLQASSGAAEAKFEDGVCVTVSEEKNVLRARRVRYEAAADRDGAWRVTKMRLSDGKDAINDIMNRAIAYGNPAGFP